MTAAKGFPNLVSYCATEILDVLFKMIHAWNNKLEPQFGSQRISDSGHSFQVSLAMSETRIVRTNQMRGSGLFQCLQTLLSGIQIFRVESKPKEGIVRPAICSPIANERGPSTESLSRAAPETVNVTVWSIVSPLAITYGQGKASGRT